MASEYMSSDEATQEAKQRIAHRKMILSHPMVSRYLNRAESQTQDFRLDPRDIVGERLFLLGRPGYQVDSDDIWYTRKFREKYRLMRNAKTVLWEREATDAALSASMPDRVAIPSVPEEGLWFSFEEGAFGSTIAVAFMRSGMCHCEQSKQTFLALHFSVGDDSPYFGGDCGFGVRWMGPTHIDELPKWSDVSGDCSIVLLVKLVSFLESPYIPNRTERIEWRQRVRGRAKRVTRGADVRFVYLRRPDARGIPNDELENDGTSAVRTFGHRWIVRGHTRNQWYPSKSAHRLIYVPPYVKGPKDAPMIQKVGRVVR